MELFAPDDEIARLASGLPALHGAPRLEALLALAWHQRQRDTRRALALAAEAEELLPTLTLAPDRRRAATARLLLLHGEAEWLSAALEAAGGLAGQALREFNALGDAAGSADAPWLLASIANDHGDAARAASELEAMCAAAGGLHPERAAIAEAALARSTLFHDLKGAKARWSERYAAEVAGQPPAVACCIEDFLGVASSQSSDFGEAIRRLSRCHSLAIASGQIRRAIVAATNLGNSLTKLNELQAALEWMERGLDLARRCGWPSSLGNAMIQTAETLRHLGRHEAAHHLLREALNALAPLAATRTYAIALHYLGDVELDCKEYANALGTFQLLAQRAAALSHPGLSGSALRGQAHALSQLGQPLQALAAAQAALEVNQSHGYNQIDSLSVLAGLHTRFDLPPPPGMRAASAALHYLQQALDVAASIEGYTMPGDLLDAVARAHAKAGDFARAYETALQASAAREKTHSQEATNRAIAIQVSYQTERARAENEHNRELAASEAKRAEVLLKTSETLERLSTIGREITAHLDAGLVFQVLDRNVHHLLDASSFVIYLMTPDGMALDMAFGVEQGGAVPHHRVQLSDPDSGSARCVRERREILAELEPDAPDPGWVEGTLRTLSALYAPLSMADNVVGVMTVQSAQPHAYSDRERMIFRTLCAYGAIALDNAEAYRKLKEAQAQIVAQEKLAALGALVAGVAHELNTPIGNSLLIASSLQGKAEDIEAKIAAQTLRRTELSQFMSDTRSASDMIMRGLVSAADLVSSFKQVAVDRTSERMRRFDLQQVMRETAATMANRIKNSGHRLELDVPPGIVMESYPGPLGQVITNFAINAMLHAFDGKAGGLMRITAALAGGDRVRLRFEDDGCGIGEDNLKRIFDPFFTTKLGQGGSGLGLSICYSIVTSLLGGQISVETSPGAGAAFVLDLPLAGLDTPPQ